MNEIDPRYLDGMSELCIYISLSILSSDECIVIDDILLLLIMIGVPSSVNCHNMMYASHVSISCLTPDVNRTYSHV